MSVPIGKPIPTFDDYIEALTHDKLKIFCIDLHRQSKDIYNVLLEVQKQRDFLNDVVSPEYEIPEKHCVGIYGTGPFYIPFTKEQKDEMAEQIKQWQKE
jgi:hypothetical protein